MPKYAVSNRSAWPLTKSVSQVPFQPNMYDCGVHTLWHLRHIIDLGFVDGSLDATHRLRFTDDMVGKRLRLAQELLNEGCL